MTFCVNPNNVTTSAFDTRESPSDTYSSISGKTKSLHGSKISFTHGTVQLLYEYLSLMGGRRESGAHNCKSYPRPTNRTHFRLMVFITSAHWMMSSPEGGGRVRGDRWVTMGVDRWVNEGVLIVFDRVCR